MAAPGPWVYRADRTVADATGNPIFRCYAGRDEDVVGPLSAAAPEILNSLKECELFLRVMGLESIPASAVAARARAAIAKARGEC